MSIYKYIIQAKSEKLKAESFEIAFINFIFAFGIKLLAFCFFIVGVGKG